jgi:hypothetical protein
MELCQIIQDVKSSFLMSSLSLYNVYSPHLNTYTGSNINDQIKDHSFIHITQQPLKDFRIARFKIRHF